jgi:hypothetical protein
VPHPGEADRLICSARGCRREAAWSLRWNNPRLHRPERRKTWLACPDHRDRLADFLSLRGFLRETVPAAGPADGTNSPDSKDSPSSDESPDSAASPGSARITTPADAGGAV